MKTLIFDIETAPMIGSSFDLWKPRFNPISDPYILMIGYMWEGDEEAEILALPDHKTFYKSNPSSSEKMVKKFLKEYEKADIVVAHNAKFDVKWIHAAALMHGLPPVKPVLVECTYNLSKNFNLPTRKLSYLLERLGLSEKIKTRGIDLWHECMEGDEDAWAEMAEYCKRDVEALAELWQVLKPWSKKNLQPFSEEKVCTKCGSSDIKLHSKRVTSGGVCYPYYRCFECKGFSSGRSQVGKGVLK